MSVFVGLLAGVFGGLLGLGGAAVLIPALTYRYGIAQRQAHGTSLVVVIFSGIAGTITYAAKSSVDFGAALIMAGAAISTARWGAHYCHRLSEHRLRRFFGVFLIVMSLLLVTKSYLAPHVDPVAEWQKVLILLSVGLVTGFISGLMGVGGGALMVPAVVLLAGMSQHIAQGCSLFAMVPTAASGSYSHWRLGNVAKPLLPGLIAGVLAGTYFGGMVALVLPENVLRAVFAVVLTGIGIRYIARKPDVTCEEPNLTPQSPP